MFFEIEKIHHNHSKQTFLYVLSRILERTSFYGLRSIIILYMVGQVLKMEHAEALAVYGWFTTSFLFSKVFGAILGDLVIGNKKALIIGAISQTLGAFTLCTPSITGLYVGLFFIVLGGGLYTPNIISNFGKIYLNKTRLLDAGFTILFLAVNVGAFIGVLSIGYIGEKYGWNVGFVIAGILMILSLIPILLLEENKNRIIKKNKTSTNQKIINSIVALVAVSIFWSIYEIGNIRTYDLQVQLSEFSKWNISRQLVSSLNAIFLLPISLLAIIIWTFFYKNHFFKLIVGFIFGILSFGILLLIPEISTEKHAFSYLLSIFFLVISEIHISPIFYSILTKNSNPKYLAITISLAFVPIKLISIIFMAFSDIFYDNPIFSVKFAIVTMIIITIGLVIFIILRKKNSYN